MRKIVISYEPDKMVFTVGKEEFYISRDEAAFLFDENIVKKFKEDFSEWNLSQDFIARFDVCYEHFGRDVNKVAKFLKIDVSKLKRWIAQGSNVNTEFLKRAGFDVYEKLKSGIKKELFPEPEQEQPKIFNPNQKQISKVAELIGLKKMGPREIAQKLKISYPEYISWASSKAGANMLNSAIRNLKGGEVIRHVKQRVCPISEQTRKEGPVG